MRRTVATLAGTIALLAAALAVTGMGHPTPASADHRLTGYEARYQFKRYAYRRYDVDYFHRQPRCFKFSRYLFRCSAVVVYFDGDSDCAAGSVRAAGRRHHTIRVRIRAC